MARSTPAGGTFRPDVEGLRAVAVTVVVLYHAGVAALPGGFVGVDVFFVISGFLITSLLLREHAATGRVSMLRFYARRARRLLPAASLALVVTAAVSFLLLGAGRARDVLTDGVWATLFAANLRLGLRGTDYLAAQAAPSPLQHFWSLAVEEQFYLVWPLVVVVAARAAGVRLRRALAGVLLVVVAGSLAWSVVQTAQAATWAYFSPLTRAWELGVGALLAAAAPRLPRLPQAVAAGLGWLGLAAILAACVGFSGRTAFPGWAAVLPVAGAAAVLVAGARARTTGGPAALLAARPMQWVGRRSYSWYLWHWPALVLAAAAAGRDLSAAQGLAVGAGSLVVAAAAYALVEDRVRRSRRLAADPAASLRVGVAVTTVTALVLVALGAGAARSVEAGRRELAAARVAAEAGPPLTGAQLAAQVRASAAATSLPAAALRALPAASGDIGDHDDCQAPRDGVLPPAPGTCEFGAPGGARTLVLFGDSHVMMWLPGLDRVAARRGWRIVALAKSACPAVDLTVYDGGRGQVYTECDGWREAALARVEALAPDLVVVSSNPRTSGAVVQGRRTPMTPQLWEPAQRRVLARLAAAAGAVTVVGDIPLLAQSAPDCLGVHRRHPARCATPADVAAPPARRAAERAAVTAAGAGYVDVTPWLCTPRVCPPTVGDTVAYYNVSHVSAAFARKAGDALATELGL